MAAERDPRVVRSAGEETFGAIRRDERLPYDQAMQLLKQRAQVIHDLSATDASTPEDQELRRIHVANIMADIIRAIQSVHDHAAAKNQSGKRRNSESKGALGLKVFSGDKKEFQGWLEKLINQFAVVHDKSRELFRELAHHANTVKKEASEVEAKAIAQKVNLQDFNNFQEPSLHLGGQNIRRSQIQD